MLDRSYAPEVVKEIDPKASYLRGLYLPRDEMIDLADLYEDDDLNTILKDENEQNISVARIRINDRPKNRALLAIYPLSNQSKSKERTGGIYHLRPIECEDVQFAIMVVFPETKIFGDKKYIINPTIYKPKKINDHFSNSIQKPAPPDPNLFNDVPSGRAISIRQPFVEEILLGKKTYEYRSRPTKIRGRVFLYASNTLGDTSNCNKFKINISSLIKGKIVGSVEIIDCEYLEDKKYYGYKLKNPIRYDHAIEPQSQPQPLFFFPFQS